MTLVIDFSCLIFLTLNLININKWRNLLEWLWAGTSICGWSSKSAKLWTGKGSGNQCEKYYEEFHFEIIKRINLVLTKKIRLKCLKQALNQTELIEWVSRHFYTPTLLWKKVMLYDNQVRNKTNYNNQVFK